MAKNKIRQLLENAGKPTATLWDETATGNNKYVKSLKWGNEE